MSANKRAGVVPTERDELLFRYLFVNKAATVEDVAKDIFKGTSTKTVHRRLLKLSRAGLVEASGQREKGNRMVYSLTKKGFGTYVADEGTAGRVQLKSDSIDHDLTLLEIKRRLRALENVAAVYSENLLRSGVMDDTKELRRLRELRPDAVVKLKIQGDIHFLPLEYEASAKYSKRNAELLAKYYTNPHVAGVVFISKTGAIEKKMRRKEAARNPQKGGKFYYCQLADVLDAEGKLQLANAENAVLSIQ